MTSYSDALPLDRLPLGFDETLELIDGSQEVGRGWLKVVGALVRCDR